jgi:hypothetical protein
MKKIYQKIAGLVGIINNSENSKHVEKARESLRDIEREYLPSGSGIDCGIKVDLDRSSADQLTLVIPYHCMSEHGYYCGWMEFECLITPSLQFGFNIDLIETQSIDDDACYGVDEYLTDLMVQELSKEIAA